MCKKSDFVLVKHHGPLYIIDTYRDSSGKCYVGINGKDGVSYCFNVHEVIKKITEEEFRK